jgi:L-malate glycosyltransferase
MNKPKRLLHVFSTFAVGGPQVRAVQLMNAWGPRVQHGIIASDNRYDALDLINANVDAAIAQDFPPMKGQSLIRTLRETGTYLKNSNWNMLLTYNWGAVETAFANRLFGHKPHVHHEDGFGPDEAIVQNKKRILFRKLALPAARAIVVPSHTLEKIACDQWGFRKKLLRNIPNGVDMRLYETAPALDALAPLIKNPGDVWVGIVSGLRPEKNVARLVRVFAATAPQFPQAKLIVCGTGGEAEALKALATDLNIENQIYFAGFQAHPHRYMGLFDIYAISSDTEQFPIAQVEAMAAGAAFCGTDVGDVRAILPEAQREFVGARDDEAAFSARLAALLADAPLRAALGAQNKAHVAKLYSFDRMVLAYETLYGLA